MQSIESPSYSHVSSGVLLCLRGRPLCRLLTGGLGSVPTDREVRLYLRWLMTWGYEDLHDAPVFDAVRCLL